MSKYFQGNVGVRDSSGNLLYSTLITNTILQQLISVTTTATALPATAMSERTFLMIQNDGTVDVFIGSSTVAASGATTGIRLRPGAIISLAIEPDVIVYGIVASGTCNVIVFEGS